MNSAAPKTAARRRRKRWIIGGIAVVVVLFLGSAIYGVVAGGGAKPVTAAAATVSTKTLNVVVSGDGHTMPVTQTEVYPAVSGTVTQVSVSLGSHVSQGQKLYSVSQTTLHTSTLQASAAVAQAQQSRSSASQQLSSAQQAVRAAQANRLQAQQAVDALNKSATATKAQKDLAKKQLLTAQAGVTTASQGIYTAQSGITGAQRSYTSAQNAYSQALKNERSTVVRAPVDGVVTTLNAVKGATVSNTSAGAAVASSSGSSTSSASVVISDVTTMKVRVAANEVDVANLKTGQKGTLTFDALPGKTIEATVSWIAPTGTSTSGVVTYDVDMKLAAQDANLRPGMTATADITTKTIDNATVVPNSALKVDGQKNFVLTQNPDGTSKRAYVTIGANDDQYTQITSGLTVGEAVVTSNATANPFGGN